jgi:outer membrane receptor protein involved in Fe transport
MATQRKQYQTKLKHLAALLTSIVLVPVYAADHVSASSGEQVLPTINVKADQEATDTIGYSAQRSTLGTKTDTTLKDIPQTIDVVPAEELRDRGVIKITDVFNTVPGVQAGTGYGGLGNGYGTYIRGFSGGTNYRDGFRDFSFVSPRDIALFERVEVLKGPSSVLYGTNDPGA